MTKNAHFLIDVQTWNGKNCSKSDDRVYSQNGMEKILGISYRYNMRCVYIKRLFFVSVLYVMCICVYV